MNTRNGKHILPILLASVVQTRGSSHLERVRGYEKPRNGRHLNDKGVKGDESEATTKDDTPKDTPAPKDSPTDEPAASPGDDKDSPSELAPAPGNEPSTPAQSPKDSPSEPSPAPAPKDSPSENSGPPTLAPTKGNDDNPTTAAPSKAIPAEEETLAPTATKNPPTAEPTPEPTSKPEPAGPSMEDYCKEAGNCEDCQEKARDTTNPEKICWYVESTCVPRDKTELSIDKMCKVDTLAPTHSPNPRDDDGFSPGSSYFEDDSFLPNMILYGAIFLVATCLLCVVRRFIPHRKRPENSQYHTVATDEEADEWGWGDEDASPTRSYGDIELAKKKTDASSDDGWDFDDSPTASASPSFRNSPQSAPLPARPPPPQPARASPKIQPVSRITPVSKPKPPKPSPPKEKDLFAEMGLSPGPAVKKSTTPPAPGSQWASTPTPAPTKTLGAKALPMDDDDMNFDDDDDWGDDADLDDLLDD